MSDRPTVPGAAAVLTRRDVRLLVLVVAVELLLVAGYFTFTPAQSTRLRYALYPFVWIDVAGLAVAKTRLPSVRPLHHWGAVLVASLYLVVLLSLAGLVGLDVPPNPPELVGVHFGVGSPGWERLRLVAPTFHVTIVPFRVIGYLALSYLVYATLVDTARAAVAGAIGLGACISCSFPIVASLAAGLFGSTAALTDVVYSHSIDLSTATFLLAVGLLYWRPGFAELRRALGDRRE